MSSSNTKSARIVLSEDEDDHRLSDGDNDDDEQNMEPMSAEALELLETEKVLKAGYLLKKGEKRRVCILISGMDVLDGKFTLNKIDLEEALVCTSHHQISHVQGQEGIVSA